MRGIWPRGPVRLPARTVVLSPAGLKVGSTFFLTFTLGVLLQLIAVRSLPHDDYSTFVLGLAVGNVASGIAATIQPVVAVQAARGELAFLPASAPQVVLVAGVTCVLATVGLATFVEPLMAVAIVAQLPLHAVVGIGQGRIQGAGETGKLAASISMFAVLRLLVVVPFVMLGVHSAYPFVVSLPLALGVTLLFLLVVGAFGALRLHANYYSRELAARYLMWAALFWFFNSDAVYSRLFLTSADAGSYAIAFTLGRLPLFMATPLGMALLPAAMSEARSQHRRILFEIAVVGAVLLLGTALVLGVVPSVPVFLLSGDAQASPESLVRAHAVIGALAALVLLQLTLLFGIGKRADALGVATFVAPAIVTGAVAMWSHSATTLAYAQLVAMLLIASFLFYEAWFVTGEE